MKFLIPTCMPILPPRGPVTWMNQAQGPSGGAPGRHADPLGEPIRIGERIVGMHAASEDMESCFLGDLAPPDPATSREDQAAAVFEQMEDALSQCGMTFHHVARTWFFLDRITDWYDGFNAVRTRFFNSRGVFDGLVPASTGVGISNRHGAALTASALAIRPLSPRVTVRTVPSPLQCEPFAYRSAFSRAVEVASPGGRCLLVSGTASIEPAGKTLHVDRMREQVDHTLDVVAAILESRGMDWTNVHRAIVYFKDLVDLPFFERVCRNRGLAGLAATLVEADICRDDLLFEIELDALTET